jgi:phage gp36-like protein
MPYCTEEDLVNLIPRGELAQLTTEAGDEPDAVVVAQAIAQADAEIDSYLGVRYVLPLAETPARVRALSVDMALYHLYSRRSLMPEVRRDKYRDAVGFLKDVTAGRAQIMGLDGKEEPGAAGDVITVGSADRVFSRDKMGGF